MKQRHTDDRFGELDVDELEELVGVHGRVDEGGGVHGRAPSATAWT
jgi:hypothetical protein